MLRYSGKAIIPAPLVTLNKTYQTTEDGGKIGANYDITLTGTLLPFKGSPSGHYTNLADAFWELSNYPPDESYAENNEDFNSILRKQEAIRWLFSQDGQSLEWQPQSGQPVVKCNPRILDISFTEGIWTQRCDYTIRLQADWIYINGTLSHEDTFNFDLIESAGEAWSFEDMEGREGQMFRVTHDVNARGILGYDETGSKYDGEEAWQHAKAWCDTKAIGLIPSGVLTSIIGVDTWMGGAYTKTSSIGSFDGTYSIKESWTLGSGNHYIEKSFSIDYSQENDEYRVRYDGIVYGVSSNKAAGDVSAMDIARDYVPSQSMARAEALIAVGTLLGGATIGESPYVKSVGLNQSQGTASFSYEWNSTENPDVLIYYEANVNYTSENSQYVITLSADIRGLGDTSEEKLNNARGAVPSDAAAREKAIEIIDSLIPDTSVVSNTIRTKVSAVNEKSGTIRVSWTWDTSSDNQLEVSIQDQNRAQITAILPIPGRLLGPVIQDMNTVNEKITTITIKGKGYTARPSSSVMRTMCDEYLSIPSSGFIMIGDSENWSPTAFTYDRTIRYLIKEGF